MTKPTWEFKINFGNVLVLAGMIASVAIWYGMVSAHLSDSGMHVMTTTEQRQAVLRTEVAQQLAPMQVEVGNLGKSVDKMVEAVGNLREATARLEETLRHQRARQKEDEFRDWRESRGDSNERP